MCDGLNDDLEKKSRIVVLEDITFAPRNSIVFAVYIQINFVGIERVYRTEFLGVIIDSKLSGKNHIDYTCN